MHLILLHIAAWLKYRRTHLVLAVALGGGLALLPLNTTRAQSRDRYDFFFRGITHFASMGVDTCFQQWQCLPFPGYPSLAQRQAHHIASITVEGTGYAWDDSANRWLLPSAATNSSQLPLRWIYSYAYTRSGQLATVQWTQTDSSSQQKSQLPFARKASYEYDTLGRIVVATTRLLYIRDSATSHNWEYYSPINQPSYETKAYFYDGESTQLRHVLAKQYYYPRGNSHEGWKRLIYWTKSDYHYDKDKLQYIATHASTTDSLELTGAVASGYTFFKYNRQHLAERITTRNIEEEGIADTLRWYGSWSFTRTAWIYRRNRLLREVESHGFLDVKNPELNLKRIAAADLRSYFDHYFRDAPARDLPFRHSQRPRLSKQKNIPLDSRAVNLMIRQQISYDKDGLPHKSRGSTAFDATWTRSTLGYKQAFRVYGKGKPFLTRYVLQQENETTAEMLFTAPNPELVEDGYQDPHPYLWTWNITKLATGLATHADFYQELLTPARTEALRRLRLRNAATALAQDTNRQLVLRNSFKYTFFQP